MLRIGLVLGLLGSCLACDGGFGTGGGELPALDVFRILKPHEMQARGSSSSSAVCSTSNDNYALLSDIIDAENAMHEKDRELLDAALAQNPVVDQGIAEYQAEVDGRTLLIEVVSDASEGSVFTGTLIDEDGEEHEVMQGVKLADKEAGTLTMSMPDSETLEVVFEEDDNGERRVVRQVGDHQAVMEVTDDAVRLVIDDTIAWWNTEDYAGIVLTGDGLDGIGCFSGGASADDYCDAECSAELIGQVTGSAGL